MKDEIIDKTINIAGDYAQNTYSTLSKASAGDISGQDIFIIGTFGLLIIILFFISPLVVYKLKYKDVNEDRIRLYDVVISAIMIQAFIIIVTYSVSYVFNIAQESFGAKGHYLFSYIGAFFALDWSIIMNYSLVKEDPTIYTAVSIINIIYIFFNTIILSLVIIILGYFLGSFLSKTYGEMKQSVYEFLSEFSINSILLSVAMMIHIFLPFNFLNSMITVNENVNKDFKILIKNITGSEKIQIPINYADRFNYILKWD